MKLRNKKTGDIVEFNAALLVKDGKNGEQPAHLEYPSIKAAMEEWEDYEGPKDYYVINLWGEVSVEGGKYQRPGLSELGLTFETKEEAEKAVEKLKAITRLNKCEFRFEGYNNRDRANGGDIVVYAHVDIPNNNLLEEAQPAMLEDLDILFGGEE